MQTRDGITTRTADWSREQDCAAYLALMDHFMADEQGGGDGWPDGVREALVPAMRERADVTVILAEIAGEPVGLATCIEGFSTFSARPVLNLHDLMTHPEHRRRGIGRALLEGVEGHARRTGCCKLTLEVHANNAPALDLYRRVGFGGFGDEARLGRTLFLEMALRD